MVVDIRRWILPLKRGLTLAPISSKYKHCLRSHPNPYKNYNKEALQATGTTNYSFSRFSSYFASAAARATHHMVRTPIKSWTSCIQGPEMQYMHLSTNNSTTATFLLLLFSGIMSSSPLQSSWVKIICLQSLCRNSNSNQKPGSAVLAPMLEYLWISKTAEQCLKIASLNSPTSLIQETCH